MSNLTPPNEKELRDACNHVLGNHAINYTEAKVLARALLSRLSTPPLGVGTTAAVDHSMRVHDEVGPRGTAPAGEGARNEVIEGLWKYGLVIESAVRNLEGKSENYKAIVALVKTAMAFRGHKAPSLIPTTPTDKGEQ